ncbi:MAG: hypothetical protein KGQ61_12450 [Planctomycetes bacterium]|nr:hypothetical protein [Planctomycetota bacterium]
MPPLALCLLATCLLLFPAARIHGGQPTSWFDADTSARVRARLDVSDRHYRQIEPALARLADVHAASFARLDAAARTDRLVALAAFIDRLRDAHADDVVIGSGRTIIGLLDPDPGLAPKEITALADAYGASATVLKRTGSEPLAEVAERFLAAIEAAAAASAPATIIVLGHGLPEEIQSYAIPVERVAAALVAGSRAKAGPTGADSALDLGHLVIICDDCYSADFLTNLGRALERQAAAAGRSVAALPACIAGTSYGRVGRADVAAAFVPHFWKDVIELYYVRRPWPDAITLGGFFDAVDNMMYGYGRVAVVEGGRVVGYRTVDPDAVQDPVVFISLTADEMAELRRLLDLPADAALPRLLDIG